MHDLAAKVAARLVWLTVVRDTVTDPRTSEPRDKHTLSKDQALL